MLFSLGEIAIKPWYLFKKKNDDGNFEKVISENKLS